jgi:PAS domain S-box-containing protein
MSREVHNLTMSWKPPHEGDPDAAMARPAVFGNELESARYRTGALREVVGESHIQKSGFVLEVVEQLEPSLEELPVAGEELRRQNRQNDELLTTRSEPDAERQKYEELFEFAPDGYLVTDANGVILEANRKATHLLRVERRFLEGTPFVNYVAEAEHKNFRSELRRVLRSAYHRTEFLLCPRGGEAFDAELTVALRRDSEGSPIRLHWLVRDISERKQSDEQVRCLNMKLEQRVRRRAAELYQVSQLKDQLLIREQRARSDAEAANRSKDQFLAVVAHELRTPLNAILGWAQLMRSEMGDEVQRARAGEVIERSALAQSRIINDILDVSRIVTGNLQLDMRSLDFAGVVRAGIEAARPAIDAKGIHVEIHMDTMLDESIGAVIGDSSRLQQAVGNILSNSIKFTSAGGSIGISLNRAGDLARLVVTDTGDGISPAFLPFVFDRFRQAEGDMTRRQGGLGLGLAIVSHLVKMHGGTVEASSEGEGKGSTFTMNLPLAPDSKVEPNVSDSEAHALHARSERLEGLWVAVVDDDPDARELMRVVMEAAGARVTTCGSCEDALALFSDKATAALTPRRPDVIVADIAMPGRDGFDLIRALRRLEATRGGAVPALALTGFAGEEARLRSLAEGYQEHLAKPLPMEELVNTIARLAGSNS